VQLELATGARSTEHAPIALAAISSAKDTRTQRFATVGLAKKEE
jgi:hypothetical protein